RYLRVTPRLVPGFVAHLTGVGMPAGTETLTAEALHTVFCHLARALAAERPLVWVVDDLHFGSADARAILLSLARIAHDQSMLLVATARPGLPPGEVAELERLEVTRR